MKKYIASKTNNNPVFATIMEAKRIWPFQPIGCVISIGSGAFLQVRVWRWVIIWSYRLQQESKEQYQAQLARVAKINSRTTGDEVNYSVSMEESKKSELAAGQLLDRSCYFINLNINLAEHIQKIPLINQFNVDNLHCGEKIIWTPKLPPFCHHEMKASQHSTQTSTSTSSTTNHTLYALMALVNISYQNPNVQDIIATLG